MARATLFIPKTRTGARLRQRLNRLRQENSESARQLASLEEEHARLQARFKLLREATSDGLWDAELGDR